VPPTEVLALHSADFLLLGRNDAALNGKKSR
jgi:hypothetical protein